MKQFASANFACLNIEIMIKIKITWARNKNIFFIF